MSGPAITDYFKPKASPATGGKKRKQPGDDNQIEESPSVSVSASNVSDSLQTPSVSTATAEPSTKREKLNPEKDIEERAAAAADAKEESDGDEDDIDLQPEPSNTKNAKSKNTKNSKKSENEIDTDNVTYATCDLLLHESWREQLSAEFEKAYFKTLRQRLSEEEGRGAQIFPPLKMVFRAFEFCPWDQLKVVLLGQDPYHDDGQAEGLCFSVAKGVKLPSSLKNMVKEAVTDVGFVPPDHGSLVQWAEQGVLLLNTSLTVRAHEANSHKKYGWQTFTDAVIKVINAKHSGVVFIFWGAQARKKKTLINTKKHKIVESVHPSGLSAYRGFLGSKPYSKTNDFLKELGLTPINWQID